MARTDRSTREQQRYPSLAAFYGADARRLSSREVDVGLWWRQDPEGPMHRAAWVAETGELYLVMLGAPHDGGGEVEVLAQVEDRDSLEAVLRGWRQQCGEPRSLGWLRGRAARLRERVRATPRVAPAGRRALPDAA